MIHFLLNRKAEVNIRDLYLETPLIIACREASLDVIDLILKSGGVCVCVCVCVCVLILKERM